MDENTSISLESLKEQGFTDEDLQAVQPEQPKPEEPEQPEAPATEPETAEQTAPDGDKVSKHVPYERFKEVNEKAKALAAELAAIRAQAHPAPAPVQRPAPEQPAVSPQAERAKYFAMLTDAADKEARELHGIDMAEDVTSLQFTDQKKYQIYLNTMNSLVQEKDSENRQAWKVQRENDGFIAHLQQDPLFPQVLQYSAQDLENMPNKQAKAIDAAAGRLMQKRATPEDFKLLEATIATYRERFVAASGRTPAPAQSSPLDKAEGLPRAGTLSGAKTAGMSWQQVEQLIREGKSDQIPKDMLKQIDPRLIE